LLASGGSSLLLTEFSHLADFEAEAQGLLLSVTCLDFVTPDTDLDEILSSKSSHARKVVSSDTRL
jgi:hypothetical protein